MKVLFINLPYYGHVVSTIGLVQELIKLSFSASILPKSIKSLLPEYLQHQ